MKSRTQKILNEIATGGSPIRKKGKRRKNSLELFFTEGGSESFNERTYKKRLGGAPYRDLEQIVRDLQKTVSDSTGIKQEAADLKLMIAQHVLRQKDALVDKRQNPYMRPEDVTAKKAVASFRDHDEISREVAMVWVERPDDVGIPCCQAYVLDICGDILIAEDTIYDALYDLSALLSHRYQNRYWKPRGFFTFGIVKLPNGNFIECDIYPDGKYGIKVSRGYDFAHGVKLMGVKLNVAYHEKKMWESWTVTMKDIADVTKLFTDENVVSG